MGKPKDLKRGGQDLTSGVLRNALEKESNLSKERLVNWCLWKVALPLAVMIALYPAYRFILELKHPFDEAFAHGDLLLFSVLILLEAAVEGEHIKKQGLAFRTSIGIAKIAAILVVLSFGILKYDIIMHTKDVNPINTLPEISPIKLQIKLHYYSYFNCVVAVGSIAYSLLAYFSIMAKENEERLNEMAGG